jgi:CBS domain-containing protein
MLSSVSVNDYMAANLVSFTPDMDVLRAIHLLIENRISGAPVLDEHGNLLGMLSERDCVKVALNAGYYGEFGGPVSDYMTSSVQTIDADTSIVELAQLFIDKPFRRYPVVDGTRLIGQISVRDVLRALEVMSDPDHSSF